VLRKDCPRPYKKTETHESSGEMLFLHFGRFTSTILCVDSERFFSKMRFLEEKMKGNLLCSFIFECLFIFE